MLYSLFLLYVQIEVYQNVLKLSSLPCAFTMFFVTESSILDVARDCKSTYEGTQMSLQNVRSSHELSLLGKTNLLFINTWLLSLLLEIHNEAADEQSWWHRFCDICSRNSWDFGEWVWSCFQLLQECLCQQFLPSHSKILEFSAYRMHSFDLWS